MELRRLRYFLRVAAEGSLGRASRALAIAQPALGRQIQLLEAELGVRLFQRVPKGMRLTEEGEYLRDALDHPIKQIDTALRSVRTYSTRIETAFSLGLPPPLSRILGPRLFAKLCKEVPNLRLRIAEDHSARLAADLQRGLIDIAILVGVTPDDRVFQTEVLREELLLVGPTDSPLSGRESVPLAELEKFPLILPGLPDGLQTRLQKLVAGRNAAVSIHSEVDSADVAKQIVETGTGYTILPAMAVRTERQSGTLACASLDPKLEQPAYYAVQPHWRVRRDTYNEVERVIFEVLTAAVQNGEWPAQWLFDHRRLSTYAE